MIFPREVSNRMMKIDVGIGKVISPSGSRNRVCPDEIEGGLCITLDNFSGLGSLRNAIAIRFQLAPFYLDLVLSRRLFRIMKALVGFRTVFVCVGPPPEFSKDNDERYIKFAREIEEEMVSTMGPSTMRQVGLRTYLEFHPLEHMQADLRAQMDS